MASLLGPHGPLGRVVAWLREGYPTGVPEQDYIPLLALLRRRLSDEEVATIGRELVDQGLVPAEAADIAVSISKVTDQLPSPDDIDRVREHLAFRGFPIEGGGSEGLEGPGPAA